MGIFGRSNARDVMTKGDRAAGRIVAIDIGQTKDDPPKRVDTYVVQLGPDRGSTRAAVRQYLSPDAYVRLGMDVAVWVKGEDVVIDWAQTLAAAGVGGDVLADTWKMGTDPGFTGVHDSTLGLEREQRKGVPAAVTVRSAEQRSAAFGLANYVVLDCVVEMAGQQPYALELKKVEIPHYATHLLQPGVVLPGFVRQGRPDKVAIDWPAATNANPGAGMPPSELFLRVGRAGVNAMSVGGWAGGDDDDDDDSDFHAAVAGAGGMGMPQPPSPPPPPGMAPPPPPPSAAPPPGMTVGGWTIGAAGNTDPDP
ncbi:MAG: hypothetical protein M9961_13965, partial [Ilumatobacteraceae bacterium]|nr:hypothetical protein [Ilumatobacteraceae bacterium]